MAIDAGDRRGAARRLAEVALRAAQGDADAERFAVIVVVRAIGGTEVNVSSNILGGQAATVGVLREALNALRGGA